MNFIPGSGTLCTSNGLTTSTGLTTTSISSTSASGNYLTITNSGSVATVYCNNTDLDSYLMSTDSPTRVAVGDKLLDVVGRLFEIAEDQECTIKLPDDSVIFVTKNGYRIYDKHAKVKYKANRVLEFNRYINSSDLLQEFIEECGELGVRQDKVLNIPIETFIYWLIHKAADQDQEEVPEDVPQLTLATKPLRKPRCKKCQRFISHAKQAAGISFCNGACTDAYMVRVGL